MSEVEYLPVVAFPFVALFKSHDLPAFEGAMCMLVHWQRGYLATFPSPPITILSSLEQVRVHRKGNLAQSHESCCVVSISSGRSASDILNP